MEKTGRKEDAANVLVKSAKQLSGSGEIRYTDFQRPNISSQPNFPALRKLYLRALALLTKAHFLAPHLDFRYDAARLLTEIRNSKHNVQFSTTPQDLGFFKRREWAGNYLGPFLEAAQYFIENSPGIRNKVGPIIHITPTPGKQNNVVISGTGYYHALVHLTVKGLYGTGYYKALLEENPKKLDPVDLFSKEPRAPVWEFRLKSPRWGNDPDNVEQKLSAKTGEFQKSE